MNITFNNSTVYRDGLIEELLLASYKDITSTLDKDRKSFNHFDAQVKEHPQWLGLCVFITSVDGIPIGFVSFDPRERPVAEIGHNCVLPEHRWHGIGTEQMKVALDEIKKQGFEKVIVSTGTNEDFASARKMYTACGFVETGRFLQENSTTEMVGYELDFKENSVYSSGMNPEIRKLNYTYKKPDTDVWVLNTDDIPIEDAKIKDQQIVHLAPLSVGGNHKYPRTEWFIGIGNLEFVWLDESGKKHIQHMHPEGQILLITVPPFLPHAVRNASQNTNGVLFEYGSEKMKNVVKVKII